MANVTPKNTDYPVYRRLNGVDVWFKILSATRFVEVKRVGTRFVQTEVEARQFPEIQLIRDMEDCFENRWIEIFPEEFDASMTKV